MSKLILNDESEFKVDQTSWLYCIIINFNTFAEFGSFVESLTPTNLSKIKIDDESGSVESYFNTALIEPHFMITLCDTHIKVQFGLYEKSGEELKVDLAESVADMLTDEQALTVVGLYPSFESLIGKTVAPGTRFTYTGDLYKVITSDDLEIQAQYVPGQGTSAIYSRISNGQEGTIEDPIDVPDDVTTNAFTYITGKYYEWNGAIYKCERSGDPDGVEYSFVYSPDQLIGHYFSLYSANEENEEENEGALSEEGTESESSIPNEEENVTSNELDE